MARNATRPLSPHLTIWKPGIHMAVSIFNRAMGVGLATVGAVAFLGWIVAMAAGKETYDAFMGWAAWPPAYVIWIGLTFAYFFHLCLGLRHFVLDVGAGYELKANRMWAWVTVAASAGLTAAVWLTAFAKGMF
jgi:succinate dehydrogenase / fumarate reductase, cytochrome b subunit